MKAKVTANPTLRLRELPNGQEIALLPYETIVNVEDWASDDKWAYVSVQGRKGYAIKEYLSLINPSEEGNHHSSAEISNSTIENPDFLGSFSYSTASGADRPYVVYQVTLKEKFIGTGSGNLTELEDVINHFFHKGYRLHSMSTSNGGSKGGMLGDRIQATLVFEKINLFA